jgi:uncharacterized protein YjbK
MSPHIENETKFELDASEFDRLRAAAQVARLEDQLNVYFDKGWRLANLAATFRVRLVDNSPVMTFKLPAVWSNENKRTTLELEYSLGDADECEWFERSKSIDVETELPPDMAEALLTLGVNTLQRVGEMRNRRYVMLVGDLGQVELDEVLLPNGEKAYEAEIEGDDDQTRSRLVDWIRREAPNARPSTATKFQRFRAAAGSTEERQKSQLAQAV